MPFPRAAAVSPRLEHLEHTGSTNDDLVARATGTDAASWPSLSVVVTTDQRSGRGRLGRSWVAPAGSSLAASVLLRIEGVPVERWGWVPLLAGAAMTRAVRAALATVPEPAPEVTLKWPNDVLIDGAKVCGILCELLPAAVVVGSGVNVSLGDEDLPTLTSTSLALAGVAEPDADALLADYLTELSRLIDRFTASAGDAEASGLRAEVQGLCGTIGTDVRVHLPDGSLLEGRATGLDGLGRIVVRSAADSSTTAIAAGDVTHLR
ncbi:biotin--[acetyl-CoA-carboxylase] ligase [Planctomonas deserti]|uniref:biotin--[acetyl-CoA-carboxylase] ligase n=1 Tax=Planctomonas deserti TaxID=2144185 RepID=UPI000D3D76C3|nr:biotin--[acetyl-CoA-carboxylase] ligase [Planctomonas deserti]